MQVTFVAWNDAQQIWTLNAACTLLKFVNRIYCQRVQFMGQTWEPSQRVELLSKAGYAILYKNDLPLSVWTHVAGNTEHPENSWCFKHFFQARCRKCVQSTLMVCTCIHTYTDIWKIIRLWKDGKALTFSTEYYGQIFTFLLRNSLVVGSSLSCKLYRPILNKCFVICFVSVWPCITDTII